MQLSQLKKDRFYYFDHEGKGARIVALFKGIYEDLEDPIDPEKIEVEVWTGPGSGQERFANSMQHLGSRKLPVLMSGKRFRPSQITDINAPSTTEQERFMESVEHSLKNDYVPDGGSYGGGGYTVQAPVYTPAPIIKKDYRMVAAALWAAAASATGLAVVIAFGG